MLREFKRNTLLQITPGKMSLAGILIGLSLLFIMMITDSAEGFWELAGIGGWSLACFLLIIGGCWQSADGILGEVNNRTWITQKMTGVSAGEMLLGKLFGPSSYIWMVSLILLLFPALGMLLGFSALSPIYIIQMVVIAIGLHALSLNVSLVMISKNNSAKQVKKTGSALAPLFFGWLILSVMFSLNEMEHTIKFLGIQWEVAHFNLLQCLYFSGWMVVGLYRLMRRELQYENGPGYWIAFVLCTIIWINGFPLGSNELLFLKPEEITSIHLWISWAFLFFLTYFSMSFESISPLAIRRIVQYIKVKKYQKAAATAPISVYNLGLLLICLVVVMSHEGVLANGEETSARALLPLSMLFFLLRDLGLFFLFKELGGKRGEMYMIFAMIILYGMIPGICMAAQAFGALSAFYPLNAGETVTVFPSLIFGALWVALVGGLIYNRSDRLFGVKEK